jgi:hypothetical protein
MVRPDLELGAGPAYPWVMRSVGGGGAWTSRIRATLFLFLSLVLVGCGHHWTIIRQASPNPFGAGSKVYVDRVSLQGLIVGEKSEAEWMSEKGDDTRQSWEGDKVAMNDQFMVGFHNASNGIGLVDGPQANVIVRTHFVHYEPGFYTYFVNAPGTIEADVYVMDQAGNVLDEIRLKGAGGGFSAGERCRHAALQIGDAAGAYVKERLGL